MHALHGARRARWALRGGADALIDARAVWAGHLARGPDDIDKFTSRLGQSWIGTHSPSQARCCFDLPTCAHTGLSAQSTCSLLQRMDAGATTATAAAAVACWEAAYSLPSSVRCARAAGGAHAARCYESSKNDSHPNFQGCFCFFRVMTRLRLMKKNVPRVPNSLNVVEGLFALR